LDLFDIHNDVYFLANKEMNYWTRAEIDSALHTSSQAYFRKYYNLYFAKDQDAIDALSPFKKKYSFTEADTPKGLIDISDEKYNYCHLLSIYLPVYDSKLKRVVPQEVIPVNEDELPRRLRSQMEPVTKTTPTATEPGLGLIQLYPEVPNTGHIFYLKNPDAPVFKASYDDDTREERYNKNNSTQLEWADTYVRQIIVGAAEILATNIQSQRLQQYLEAKQQTSK